MRNLLKWLLLLVIIGVEVSNVHSQQVINHSPSIQADAAYCQDASGAMTIDEVVNCSFVSRKDLPKGALSDLTVWVRLTFNKAPNNQTAVAVSVGPHFLSSVQLYEKAAQGWQVQSAGSSLSFKNDSHAKISGYAFQLNPSNNSQEIVYIRVYRSGLNLILIDVAEFDQQGLESMSQLMGMGIHIGAMALILIFAVFNYWMNPNVIMFRFCWLMIDVLLCILSGTGILAKYVFDQQPWLDITVFHWLVCLRLACWVWVSRAFLQSYPLSPWYSLSCKLIYSLVVVALVVVLTEHAALLQQLLLLAVIAISVTQIIAILKIPELKKTFRNALLIGFVSIDVLTFLTIILAARSFDFSYLSLYVGRLVDFVTPLVLLAIFAFRSRLIREELVAVKELNAQINMNLEFEKNLFKERQILFDMLTHELKNPLASISLAVNSIKNYFAQHQDRELRRLENIELSVKNMDLIIERCSLMNQIDQKEITPHLQKLDLAANVLSIIESRSDRGRMKVSLDQNLFILADSYFLKIILSNLLENALKYSPESSLVQIDVKVAQGREGVVTIAITNEVGTAGRPDPELVFSRFYRSPFAQAISGSGLGLNLVKELSKIMGFTISYEPTVESVSFVIEMPLFIS